MTGLSVSVVVASRGRPESLALCLTALSQQDYHPFEIVVVADAAGRAAASAHDLSDRLKIVACDEANLSRARNLGIAAAGGEIVAFIDDDAFAEPDWLGHLAAPFADRSVAGAGGYVIGRNGFSVQSRARWTDPEGWDHTLEFDGDAPQGVAPPDGGAVRVEGANMAFRRDALVSVGGFDEAFRFYLDETDLVFRLAPALGQPVLVPRARVHHAAASSETRSAERAPRRLFEIGASTAAFLRRHAAADRCAPALADHRGGQERRLLRHMVMGRLMPADVPRLLADFDAGAEAGADRAEILADIAPEAPAFRPLFEEPRQAPRLVLAGWAWRARDLATEASRLQRQGALVHVMRFTPTALYHRRAFIAPGYWLQTGGLFGRSERDGPLLRAARKNARARQEVGGGPLRGAVPFDPRTW